MKSLAKIIPPVMAALACVPPAAHFLAAGRHGFALAWLSAPLALLIRQRWVGAALPAALSIGAGHLMVEHINARAGQADGGIFIPAAAIFAILAAGVLLVSARSEVNSKADEITHEGSGGIWAFFLAAFILAFAQIKTDPPALLLERFIEGGGWLETYWLSVYAAVVATSLADPARSLKWRPRLWALFSAVFFAQLFIGLAGLEVFLMTGKLHLPVPALIVAGPVYRGGGFFMLILFLSTIALAGPAWCSWLCYIGAWDDQSSRLAGALKEPPRWRRHVRPVILVLSLALAYGLGVSGAPAALAGGLALAFGLLGVAVMLTWSRRSGYMMHCTAYCPVGWVSTRLGKLNPMRVRIDDACVSCGKCARVCRYDALRQEDLANKKPGESCTLCGDCVSQCPSGYIGFAFPGLDAERSRRMFIAIVAAFHAVFLGAARL